MAHSILIVLEAYNSKATPPIDSKLEIKYYNMYVSAYSTDEFNMQ